MLLFVWGWSYMHSSNSLFNKAIDGFNKKFKKRVIEPVLTILTINNKENSIKATLMFRFNYKKKNKQKIINHAQHVLAHILDMFINDLHNLGFKVLKKKVEHIKDKNINKSEISKAVFCFKIIIEIAITKAVRVFEALLKIPKTKVVSYKDLAVYCNTHPRVIGLYMKRNPYPDIIPCYKVVRSNKSIGGYSKGIRKKIQLLRKDGVKIINNKCDGKAFYRFL